MDNVIWNEEKTGHIKLIGSDIHIDKDEDEWVVVLEGSTRRLGMVHSTHSMLGEAKIAAIQLSQEQHAEVVQFSTGLRGQFIISQALCLAIDALNQVEPEALREVSNIKDMEYLRDNLYSMYKLVEVDSVAACRPLDEVKLEVQGDSQD